MEVTCLFLIGIHRRQVRGHGAGARGYRGRTSRQLVGRSVSRSVSQLVGRSVARGTQDVAYSLCMYLSEQKTINIWSWIAGLGWVGRLSHASTARALLTGACCTKMDMIYIYILTY